jgi:hypothetical protein
MKTIVWVFTLVGTAPVLALASLLLTTHIVANLIGPRYGHNDFIVSIARNDNLSLTSTHPGPLVLILVGGSLHLLGVSRLLQD